MFIMVKQWTKRIKLEDPCRRKGGAYNQTKSMFIFVTVHRLTMMESLNDMNVKWALNFCVKLWRKGNKTMASINNFTDWKSIWNLKIFAANLGLSSS